MGEKKEEEKQGPAHKNMTFYDPANPPYETHHVCVLLGELDREAEENGKGQEEKQGPEKGE